MSDGQRFAAIAHRGAASWMLAAAAVLIAITSTIQHDTVGATVVAVCAAIAGALTCRAFAAQPASIKASADPGESAPQPVPATGPSIEGELREVRRLVDVCTRLLGESSEVTANASLAITRACCAAMPAIQALHAHHQHNADATDETAAGLSAHVATIDASSNDVLAAMQFQDVVRQQHEHTQSLLQAIGEHVEILGLCLDRTPRPADLLPMAERARALELGCVMASQRDAYAGETTNEDKDPAGARAPSVELF